MMIKVKCPRCGTEGAISLADKSYEGPYKCWKCRAAASIKLENNEVVYCEPLSDVEFQKEQEIYELKSKFKKG